MNRYSLLAHVAPSLTLQTENLATESLSYLLGRYGTARGAFVGLASSMGYSGPSDLTFDTQVQMVHGGIPDLVGATADGAGVLLVESKFWAALTPNQPASYLRQLPEGGGGMVLFVAPEGRHEELWQQLVDRCRDAGWELKDEGKDLPHWRAGSTSEDGRLACASWSFVLGRLEDRLKGVGEERGANEVWQLKELCRRLEEPPDGKPSDLRSIVDEVAKRLSAQGILDTEGYSVGQGARFYRRYGTTSGHKNWFVGYSEEYAERFQESLLWFGGPSGGLMAREPSPVAEANLPRSYEHKNEVLFPLDVPNQAAHEPVVQSLVAQVEGIADLQYGSTMETKADALDALKRAWPSFVAECRSFLGSELHYQALLYHCLRAHGQIPARQLGMNVKIWITEVVSPRFRVVAEKKRPAYQGGFEPIPDVVIFESEIEGDWRRRNYENTLRHMLMAIEVKASERHLGRLRAGEIVDDILKLDALRIEARHKRGSGVLPAVVTIDTAPEANERMRPEARRLTEDAAREHGVCLFYVSPSEAAVVLPDVPSSARPS